MARYVDAKFADKEVSFLNVDETSVREHVMASAVRPQQATAFDEQPVQFPGLRPTRTDTLCIWQS